MTTGSRKVALHEDKSTQLKPLPGYITVTSRESDEDMLSLDNSPTEKRAKMPCGHVIGPSSMTSFCRSVLSKGIFKFRCPAILNNDPCAWAENPVCNQEWPYFLVRHVACFSTEEMNEFDKKISENYLNKAAGRQQCPRCEVWGFRTDTSTNRTICSFCTAQSGVKFEFCWCCLNDWKSSGTLRCGNGNCDGLDKRIKILSTCQMKQIEAGGAMMPAMRGCPNCGTIIEHKDKCKHMDCVCGFSFCFFCLKAKSAFGWTCAAYGDTCSVAPRQTSLPGA